jgi:tripartite-type tricarboxylate transporter receptor subunit TctC
MIGVDPPRTTAGRRHPIDTPLTAAPRRIVLQGLTAAAASLAWPSFAEEAYPSRPVRIVVPFGPGGLADITMRLVGQKLAERMGQQVVIDNKPGAGGVAAASSVLTSPKDGYSLITFSNGTTIAKSLMKLPYDPEAGFVPISTVAYFDLVLLTPADGPLKSVRDVLAEAKKRQLTFGTIAAGSTQNLSGELFKSSARVNATVVPYKGTPDVLTALMRGEIDVGFESYAALKGAVDSGQVRAIAVTGTHRSPSLPAVPTVQEAGVAGYEVTGWNALYAPAGTPAAALATLHRHLAAVLALPEVQSRLRELGTEGGLATPAEMAALFKRDAAKWAAVIKQAGITVQ